MQPTLQDWLNRKPAGPKPRKRIPTVSAKRAVDNKVYRCRKAVFLKAHPICQWPVGAGCGCSPVDLHHKAGRGKNFLNESTWLALCRPCHNWVHRNPSKARELGLLA